MATTNQQSDPGLQSPSAEGEALPAPARSRRALLGWLGLLAGLGVAFGYNFVEMWARWFPAWKRTHWSFYDRISEGESYYTHGPLVPGLSLIIIAMLIRHTRIPARPCRLWGWGLLGGSLLFHLVASLARVNFASGIAFVGVVAGLVLLLWGPVALRRLWFPLLLLLFMVPAPEVSIAQLNFRLKMLAADWGVRLVNVMGIIAERSGNRVYLAGDKDLIVANVCNGLRTLVSLLAFGTVYAYVCRLRGAWRLGLFAMTIPVAVVANTLRIAATIAVADLFTPELATGWFHDVSGLLIFVVAFMLMFGLERLILWARQALGRPAEVTPLFAGVRRTDADAHQWRRMAALAGTPTGLLATGALLLVGLGAWWLSHTVPSPISDELLARSLPENVTLAGMPHRSYTLELDEQTLTILEYPAYLFRRYVAPGRPATDLCLIISRDNRKSTHPPDLCLEGSGEGIVHKGQRDLADPATPGRSIPCVELVVQSGISQTYFLYTYRSGGEYTRSFWNQQLVTFLNGVLGRHSAGALVRVNTPIDGGGLEPARQRAAELMVTALPHIDSLP